MKYLSFKKNDVLSTFLGTLTWTSLTAFMIVAKAAIGNNVIPVFEFIIMLAGFLSIKIAYDNKLKNKISFSKMVLILNISEIIFIGVLYGFLFGSDLKDAGYAVYAIIIVSNVVGKFKAVAARDYEDFNLVKKTHKSVLRSIRGLYEKLGYVAGIAGTGIAMLCITFMQVDIILFTKVMLVLNVMQLFWDNYIWYKYLYRPGK